MSHNTGKKWSKLKLIGLLAGIAVSLYLLLRPKRTPPNALTRSSPPSLPVRLFNRAVEAFNQRVQWYQLPFPLALVNLIGMRSVLREHNLHDTAPAIAAPPPGSEGGTIRYLAVRTVDGTYNDLDYPQMGGVNTRFGRNIPPASAYPDEANMLNPNPRLVSRELMTRRQFQPATILNLLAAAWLQFMVHDWVSHGKNEKENMFEVPLPEGDDWHENPMRITRTRRDPTRAPGSTELPPTYLNTETHWWDGSQIYGSSQEIMDRVRAGEEGKLVVGGDGLLPADPDTGIDVTGVTGNWWLGLGLMHTLFTLEHNAICDRLKEEYPYWPDEDLFERARLINAALMAKIHTVEWTPGILQHPVLQTAMRGNWWGLLGEQLYRRFGRLSSSEAISGIVGSPADHHGALYGLTEEFVAVYRMHPLIPDEFSFRTLANDELIQERSFPEAAGRFARERMEEMAMADIFYSFGTSHPGAITLHNYPRFLQRLKKQESDVIVDLAAIDILRDRERGVPRYNQFRRFLHMPPVKSFEALTANPDWAEEIRQVYNNDLEQVDAMVGLFAETPPPGFGFSDTAFRVFALMASRRLKSDRFFTTDYRPEIYTQVGLDWIDDNTMSTVLLRHFPALQPILAGVDNAFAPWPKAS